MRVAVRAALLAVALAAGAAGPLRAQEPAIDVRIEPEADPFPAAPLVVLASRGVPLTQQPVTLQLELSRSRTFDRLLFANAQLADTARFAVDVVMPEADSVFLRATLFDVTGRQLARVVSGHRTAPRVVLRQPVGALGVSVDTIRPLFVWSGAQVISPPGPWLYDLTVINTLTNQPAFFQGDIVDTTLRPVLALEANTPYRWQVSSRLANGPDTTRGFAESQSTFVIAGGTPVTLLYQNFPNPFPTAVASSTCIWFDLQRRSRVHLWIRDLRGNVVRTLLDGVSLSQGSYGRSGEGTSAGCVAELSWDGTDAAGRMMPPGVYLVHFRADGVESVRKALFRGRR